MKCAGLTENLIPGCVHLQLCFEDEGEHGKADGQRQTQVQVEQDSAYKGYQPHELHNTAGHQQQRRKEQ